MTDQSILGANAISGDPAGMDGLAQKLAEAEHDASDVRAKLAPANLKATWSGPAAEAFAATIGDVPKNLEKVVVSCRAARVAIQDYSASLRALRGQADGFAQRAAQARADEQRISRDMNLRAAALKSALHRSTTGTDPAARHAALTEYKWRKAEMDGLGRQRNSSHAAFDAAISDAVAGRRRFDDAAHLCVTRLDHASSLGMHGNVFTYLERHVMPTIKGAIQIGEILVQVAAEIVVDALLTPVNLIAVLLDPSAANIDKLFDSLGADLLIASVVLLVVGTALLGPAGLAAAAAVVEGLQIMLAGTKLAVHGIQVATGQRAQRDLGWDLIDVLTLGLSDGTIGTGGKKVAKKSTQQLLIDKGKIEAIKHVPDAVHTGDDKVHKSLDEPPLKVWQPYHTPVGSQATARRDRIEQMLLGPLYDGGPAPPRTVAYPAPVPLKADSFVLVTP